MTIKKGKGEVDVAGTLLMNWPRTKPCLQITRIVLDGTKQGVGLGSCCEIIPELAWSRVWTVHVPLMHV